jgi:hypothetical protein
MLCASTAPLGYATNNTDCNDGDAMVHAPQQYYVDADQDGYGSTTIAMLCSATAPVGYSTNNTDCIDNDPAFHENCGSCGNATGLSTINITTNSANLNWKASANPLQWQVQYKSTNKGAKWIDVFVPGTARTVTIRNLQANQTYNWHIRAKCGKNWTSYSIAISFKTAASSSANTVTNAITLNEKGTGLNVEAEGLQVKAFPNPASTYFTLHFKSNSTQAIKLRMVDNLGRIMDEKNGLSANSTLRVGHSYRPGVYFVQVMQGGKAVTLKLIKQGY